MEERVREPRIYQAYYWGDEGRIGHDSEVCSAALSAYIVRVLTGFNRP